MAGFHDNLRKSQGTSAEGIVRKEALQSLRLSLPMQETQLCKHLPAGLSPTPSSPFPPPGPLSLTVLERHRPRRARPSAVAVLSPWWVVRLTNSSISEGRYALSQPAGDNGTGGPSVKGLCVHVFHHLRGEQAAAGISS